MLTWVLATVVLVALLGALLVAHSGRARRRDRHARAWSEAEVEYEARRDLIPQLEETLRSYTFRPAGARRS